VTVSGFRPRSLRARLLWWLVALHLVAIATTAWLSYVAYGRLVNNFMDDQMRLVAESHATHHRLPALQPASDEDVFRRGTFVVQIFDADGRTLLASSWPALDMPLQTEPGFSDVRLGTKGSDAWRVYTAEENPAAGVQIVQNEASAATASCAAPCWRACRSSFCCRSRC